MSRTCASQLGSHIHGLRICGCLAGRRLPWTSRSVRGLTYQAFLGGTNKPIRKTRKRVCARRTRPPLAACALCTAPTKQRAPTSARCRSRCQTRTSSAKGVTGSRAEEREVRPSGTLPPTQAESLPPPPPPPPPPLNPRPQRKGLSPNPVLPVSSDSSLLYDRVP